MWGQRFSNGHSQFELLRIPWDTIILMSEAVLPPFCFPLINVNSSCTLSGSDASLLFVPWTSTPPLKAFALSPLTRAYHTGSQATGHLLTDTGISTPPLSQLLSKTLTSFIPFRECSMFPGLLSQRLAVISE